MGHLTLPKSQHDELILGAVGRAARVNGVSGDAMFRELTQRPVGAKNVANALGHVFRTSGDEIVRRHTTQPFRRYFDYVCSRGESGAKSDQDVNMTLEKACAKHRFCVHCAREDIEWFGFSFWRTTHQLPGVVACLTHGSSLIETSARPLDACPHHAPEYTQARFWSPSCLEPKVSVTLLYTRIANHVLRARPGPTKQIVLLRLRKRAVDLGIRIRSVPMSAVPSLSEVAARGSHAREIEKLLRAVGGNEEKPCASLSRLLVSRPGNNGPSTARLCIVTAILFLDADTDDALRSLTAAPTDREYEELADEHSFDIRYSTLWRMYSQTGGNHLEIARLLNLDKPTVRRALDMYGFPSLTGHIQRQCLDAFLAVRWGYSLMTACRRWSVHEDDVKALLAQGDEAIIKGSYKNPPVATAV